MSSLSTAGRPARRLLSLACHGAKGIAASGSTDQLVAGTITRMKNTGRRGYAKPLRRIQPSPPSPSPSPSQTPRPSSPPAQNRQPAVGGLSRGPPRLLFSSSDVPDAAEWEIALKTLSNKDLTATECRKGARCYVSVATQYEGQWRPKLESEYSLSPFFLHWLGILLMTANTDTRWRLGTHMLRSASELGYTPSTLTLVRIFHNMRVRSNYEQLLQSTTFRSADARYRSLLRSGRDPNAFSLQGIIFSEEGAHDRALSSFQQARKAWASSQGKPERSVAASPVPKVEILASGQVVLPEPREPRWEWEASCVLGEADILKARGKLDLAAELYRVAALELDHPTGFVELAGLTAGPPDGPERRTYLLKAAVSGHPDACRELGHVEAMRAYEKGITEREKEYRLLLSDEWVRLANGEDLETVGSNEKVETGDQGAT